MKIITCRPIITAITGRQPSTKSTSSHGESRNIRTKPVTSVKKLRTVVASFSLSSDWTRVMFSPRNSVRSPLELPSSSKNDMSCLSHVVIDSWRRFFVRWAPTAPIAYDDVVSHTTEITEITSMSSAHTHALIHTYPGLG